MPGTPLCLERGARHPVSLWGRVQAWEPALGLSLPIRPPWSVHSPSHVPQLASLPRPSRHQHTRSSAVKPGLKNACSLEANADSALARVLAP